MGSSPAAALILRNLTSGKRKAKKGQLVVLRARESSSDNALTHLCMAFATDCHRRFAAYGTYSRLRRCC